MADSHLMDMVDSATGGIAAINVLRTELLNMQTFSKSAVDEIIKSLKINIAFKMPPVSPITPKGASSFGMPPASPRAAARFDALDASTTSTKSSSLLQWPTMVKKSPSDMQKKEFPRPTFLPKTGPRQVDKGPEEWGIKYSQFKKLVAYLKEEPLYQKLKSDKGYVNLYDVNTYAIMPWTKDASCSIALLLNPEGANAKLMISHAWGEDIEELEDAIDSCVEEHDMIKSDPVLWICLFGLYQARASYEDAKGPTISEQIKLKPFEAVINTVETGTLAAMVAVQTTREDMYRRLWCNKELFEAIGRLVDIWMAASYKYRDLLVKNFEYWRRMSSNDEEAVQLWLRAGAGVRGITLAVDTQTASCSSKEDELKIRREIEGGHGGYKVLDDVVVCLRKRGTVDFMKRKAVADLKKQGCSGAEIRSCGYTAADMKTVGFCAKDLRLAGFDAVDLKRAGFFAVELKEAGYETIALEAAGFRLAQLHEAGCDAGELLHTQSYSAQQFMQAGFTATELKNCGCNAWELKQAGYSLVALREADCSPKDLKGAGYSAHELTEAGFSAGQLW